MHIVYVYWKKQKCFKRFDLCWCVVNLQAAYYHILSVKKQDLCAVINRAWGAETLTPDHTIYVNN